MGCIETLYCHAEQTEDNGLTLTWDVLKRHQESLPTSKIKINFNMGCIETLPDKEFPY